MDRAPGSSETAFTDAFYAALPDGVRASPFVADVKSHLLALWQDARCAHERVTLAPEAFAEALALAVDVADPDGWPQRVQSTDLYLACAAGRGDPAALSIIMTTVLPRVVAGLRRVGLSAGEADEVCHLVFSNLVTAAPDRAPSILAYRGRGKLDSWIRISALRTARRMYQRRREVALPDDLLADLGPADGNPELEYFKRTYAVEVKDAFRTAFDSLSDRDRTLLRLHVLGGLSPDQLAAVYHVHRTTIARQIARARDDVVERVRACLRSRLSISEADLESILRLVRSRIDITLGAEPRRTRTADRPAETPAIPPARPRSR